MRYETVDILFPIRVQKVGTDIDETYVILRRDCKLKCVKVKESEIINFTDTL